MIKVSNLNKYYNKNKSNEIHVINDVNIELPNQGLVSFLGASGSGKTTLLNVIGGLDKASGTISYEDFEMKKYDMSRVDKYRNENIGYVFQSYNLLLNETIYDNLRIALELIDIYEENEVDSRIEYALKSVGMFKYRKKKASQLSGGQQQRVAIARALVKHCRIIIADEPTGNLDSANAVEVMNILKSLSKKTLVLLVTHNESLAKFYSDYIYRIADGRIVDKQENISESTLDTVNDNIIYLKDMELIETNDNNVGIKLYSNDGSKLDLVIVERNNTFYIQSSKNIKLLDNSNIKLLDEHYKPTEKKEEDEYEYDNSFFDDSVKRKNGFSDLGYHFKQAFLRFIKPTKKVKVIYVSLVLLGFFFAICAISISNAITVDKDRIQADPNYSVLTTGKLYDYFDDSIVLQEALQKEYITDVQSIVYSYTRFIKKINFVEELVYSDSIDSIKYHDELNLICGSAPSGKDVVISKGVADILLENFEGYFNSYEELLGLTINDGSGFVSGIVDNPHKMLYISDHQYIESLGFYDYYNHNYIRYYEYESKYDTYEIIHGRDLTEEDKGQYILVSENYPYVVPEEVIGKITNFGTVVGIYRHKHGDTHPDEIIVNQEYFDKEETFMNFSYETEDYHLVEGNEPTKENECLVSIYNSLKIGDYWNGYKVVGKYSGNIEIIKANALFSVSVLSINQYSDKVFMVVDEEGLDGLLNGLYVKNMYERAYDRLINENQEIITVFMVLGVVCLIAGSIMVYFLMRSKMINDIYSIGVYRSLGSNKNKIYLKYFIEILIMVSFTAFISYCLVLFVYFTSLESMNEFLYSDFFSKNPIIPLIGVVVLYGVNIIFGLLPIFTLLRKTPSEILAKYDI